MFLIMFLKVLVHPDRLWTLIKQEKVSWFELLVFRMLILSVVPPLATWYGTVKVGWQIGNIQHLVKLTEVSAFWMAVLGWCAIVLGILVLAWFIQWMSQEYGAVVIYKKCIEFCLYLVTPLLFVGMFGVYPDIRVVMLGALFGVACSVRLLYTGLPYFMNIPKERAFVYASSVVCVGLVMFVAIMMISVVLWSVGIGPEYQ